MDLPFEILVHIFKYLPHSDRQAASETCLMWYEAANDYNFNDRQVVYFYRTQNHDLLNALTLLQYSAISFKNYSFSDVEITNKTLSFWEKVGPNIISLTLNMCDMQEKMFVKILELCNNLKHLRVNSCKELFMSGRLMEGDAEGLTQGSLNNLRSLNLADNRFLSDALFNRFVATSSTLEELNLDNCSVSFHPGLYKKFYPFGLEIVGVKSASESILTFHYILEFIKSKANDIKKLSFSHTLIDGTALNLLCKVENLNLLSLQVNSCDQLTNAGILTLTSHQKQLTHLDLGMCSRLTDQALIAVCENLSNLENLNIRRCRALTDLGVANLHQLKRLVSLDISQCEGLTSAGIENSVCPQTNSNMREIMLCGVNLDQETIMKISEKLPNLRLLDVSFCFNAITDISIQAIFKNQVQLQILKLAYCDRLSDRGLTGLCTAQRRPHYPNVDPPLPKLVPLQRISLGSRAEEEIVRDTQRKRELLKLCENININCIDTVDGYSLDRLQGLKELNMTGCNRISDVGLTYAFRSDTLKTLNLSECQQITHEGIGNMVSNCPSIENLNLINCFNLTDEGVLSITMGLKRLKTLELRGCNELTDGALEAIGKHCTCLHMLDVQGCRRVSPEKACSLGAMRTLHTILISKPGPYIDERAKHQTPAAPPLPHLTSLLRSRIF